MQLALHNTGGPALVVILFCQRGPNVITLWAQCGFLFFIFKHTWTFNIDTGVSFFSVSSSVVVDFQKGLSVHLA